MEALAQVIPFDEEAAEAERATVGRSLLPLSLWGAEVVPIESLRDVGPREGAREGQAQVLPFEPKPLKLVKGAMVSEASETAGEDDGRPPASTGGGAASSPGSPHDPKRPKHPGYRAFARLRGLVSEERGQGTTEYAILVGVLVVIAIMAILIFRDKVQELWNAIADGINSL